MALGDTVQYAGEYKLEECNLLSSTGVLARLDSNVIEINIYENIFTNSLQLSLVLVDQNNLIMNMPVVGQEFVSLKLSTPGVGTFDFTENVFSVYKVASRQDLSSGTQIYELQLISPETLRNNRTRISKSYTGLTSEIVEKILRDENLINTKKDIHIDETSRIRKFIAPNLRPNKFIGHLMRESTSKNYGGSPHYLFYETTKGFNFRVLDSLYEEPFKGKYVASEPLEVDGENKRNNLEKDYQRIMGFSLSTSNDTLISSRGGMLSSKLTKYNIFHKNYSEHTYNYFDNFKDFGRIDRNPIYNQTTIDSVGNTLGDFSNARVQLHPTSNNGTNDTQFYNSDTGYSYSDNHSEEWLLSRRSRVVEMATGGMQIQMKTRGYCNLCVGDKVQVTIPVTGKDHGLEKIDKFYDGEFLVTQLRHIFEQGERLHTMLMSIMKDSIPVEFQNVAKSIEPTGSKGQTIIQ